MRKLIFTPIVLVFIIFLLTINVSINAQDNGRFIDIRQIVKDTLDYVRTVPAPEPFKNMIYNPVLQQQPQLLPVVNGQNIPVGPSVFAPPSKNDVDKLFHLPADIFEKLASDAGYIKEPPRQYNYKENPQMVKNSNPTMGGFNFNFANENGKQQTMEEIIQQLQAQAFQSQTSPNKVQNNVQIEPIITTPITTIDNKTKSEKEMINEDKINPTYVNNNSFNTSSQKFTLQSSNKENEQKLNIVNNSNTTEITSSNTSISSFIQQPETTTNIINVSSDTFDLQGQEIILNGKKYILTRPDFVKNNVELKNNLSKEEVNLSSSDTTNNVEKLIEQKVLNNENISDDSSSSNEKKSKNFDDDKKYVTISSDNSNESTLNGDSITRTIVSDSGSFVQSEIVKPTENYPQTATVLPKSLENLLMEQLKKENKKDEEKKLMLKERKPVVDDNLSFSKEDDTKSTSTIGPINIRKLENAPKKGITKISSHIIKSNEKVEEITKPLETTEDRIELLRKSFNEQRRILAYQSRQLFTRNRINKTSQPFLATTFCQMIKELSKNVGINNIVEMAEQNCKVIKNYYPDLTCSEVLQYAEHCSLLMKLENKN